MYFSTCNLSHNIQIKIHRIIIFKHWLFLYKWAVIKRREWSEWEVKGTASGKQAKGGNALLNPERKKEGPGEAWAGGGKIKGWYVVRYS